ncbi:MAG TPA: PEPxxWA-CTERM sorting domain-containing protein [Polymorphobacter sp.]|nr:PEPxxWA-CTERM sorting domain-containing protein [Polymorphobacter sp.]
MNQFRLLAAATAAAGLLAAMPAAAVVKIAKYTGTVLYGNDQTGVFAAPGSDLTGYSWVATYTYDRSLGGIQSTDGVNYDYSYGGPGYGVAGSPVLSSTITINGVTKSVSGTYAGLVYTTTSPGVEHYAQDYSDDGVTRRDNYNHNIGNPAGAPASLDQNFGPVAGTGTYGVVQWTTFDYAAGSFTEFAYVALNADTVYSVGNAVPEPASWALMITGFGMVGGALRRRRIVATA